MIRLFNERPTAAAPPKSSGVIRLFNDAPITVASARSPVPVAPGPYAASLHVDTSGRPLLTLNNPKAAQSQLLRDRVYPGFDITKPQKLDRKMLVNGRMPFELSQAIRQELGAAYDDELDHAIALELSGSNQRENLSLIPGRTTRGEAYELNQLMHQLSRDATSGKISLLDAHRAAAKAKGRTLLEDTPVAAPAASPSEPSGFSLPKLGANRFSDPRTAAPGAAAALDSIPRAISDKTRDVLADNFLTKQIANKKGIVGNITANLTGDTPDARELSTRISGERIARVQQLVAQGKSKEEALRIVKGELMPSQLEHTIAVAGSVGVDVPGPKKTSKEPLKPSVNLNRLNIEPEARVQISKTASEVAPELSKVKGAPITHEEVLDAALSSDVLRRATSREATLKSEATLLRTRQHLAAAAESGKVTRDFIENLRIVSAEATERGRQLEALKINADPSLNTIQTRLVRQLIEMGQSTDDIVRAADGVDFTNAKQVTEFYRKFVKPTVPEIIHEYRYINLLSSPKTHIVNSFSNILQTTILRPATRLVAGGIDNFASRLAGKEQEYYIRQVPAYYRGVASGIEEATRKAVAALRGNSFIERPDLARIPTNSKILKPGQFVPRALEASDAFFRTLAEWGEREALAVKYRAAGRPINQAKIAEEAAANASELVFRKPIDASNASGHGYTLSRIDQLTNVIYQLRRVPGVRWFIPFVETPMNILKQGIEYSPLGPVTIPGNARKIEQWSKTVVGSTVFAGAGLMALQGRTTWALPTNTKDRAAFYEAGLQPYSLKIGDTWVSYSKLGPLAYPIAMAAAIRYYSKDDPKAGLNGKSTTAVAILRGIAEFFADQSYVQGIGDLMDVGRGDQTAWNRIASNIPAQLVPLASLQRWVTQIIDPIYRKAPSGVSVHAVIDNLKKGIPGLSTNVEPYRTNDGEPSRRQMPGINAVSPVTVTTETPAIDEYRRRMDAARERARKRAQEDAK